MDDAITVEQLRWAMALQRKLEEEERNKDNYRNN